MPTWADSPVPGTNDNKMMIEENSETIKRSLQLLITEMTKNEKHGFQRNLKRNFWNVDHEHRPCNQGFPIVLVSLLQSVVIDQLLGRWRLRILCKKPNLGPGGPNENFSGRNCASWMQKKFSLSTHEKTPSELMKQNFDDLVGLGLEAYTCTLSQNQR